MDQSESKERSIADTPTWSVATVTTVMVLICFVVERSIYRFGKWLRKTKRKALLASLEKIKEELMLLGLISLMLGQWSRWISSFCVKSSLFGSEFYPCSKDDMDDRISIGDNVNNTVLRIERLTTITNPCQEGYEPFVSYESLEQLHRFLFLLGVTHVFYSCFTVVLATVKIYSWKKWEAQSNAVPVENLQARRNAMMKRQTTFVFHHTSHPWSKNKVLIWMLCFFRQFMTSIKRSDYLALRLGFITNHRLPLSYDFHKYMVRSMEDDFHGIVGISWPLWGYAIVCIFINIHGLNIYFWLSFIPAILILLVGTKLQHVVANLALEIVETNGPINGSQVKPRDELFWFGKPELLLWLIQFTSFQNAFEMATFIWSVWGTKTQSCFVKDHTSLVIRLISGILAQFWCSYFTLPLNVIITQMGSRFKKALIAESVRESLYDWCKRVKEKSKYKRMGLLRTSTTSTCSLASTVEDRDDETFTIASGTISRCHSSTSHRSLNLNHVTVECADQEDKHNLSDQQLQIASLEASGYSSDSSDEVLSVDSHDSGIAEEEITHLEEDERIVMSSSVQSPTRTEVVRNVLHESNA